MMRCKYLTASRQLTFEVEAETQVELFQALASIQEVFDTESACGVCGGKEIRFLHRTASKGTKTFSFHELLCKNPECRARFEFGQAMEGGALFPHRKDKDGNYKPNRGWTKYQAGGASQQQQVTTERDPWEG